MSKFKISTMKDLKKDQTRKVESFCYETINQKVKSENLDITGGAIIAPYQTEAEISYIPGMENLINNFLTEVGLKPGLRELVRAFNIISEGNPYFEASREELAAIVYGQKAVENKAERKRSNDKIRNAIKSLQKWQEDNKLDVIQIVVLGNRIKTDEGQFRYNKTKFYFSLLDEILKSLSSAENVETSVEEVIEKLKEQYQPVEKRQPYHPKHKIQKAGKTLLTYLQNIFHWNIETKSDPVKSCEMFLRQLNERFDELSSDWKEQQSKNKFIADFERLIEGCQEKEKVSVSYNKESEIPLEK